jgi:hypothetical protein
MGLKCEIKRTCGKPDRTGLQTEARRPARSDRPRGPGGGSPPVSSGTCVFDFFLWSENFEGSLKKENVVSRVFLFGLFNWQRWELGNPSQLAFFCTHATAMTSPKSVELKLGAKESSMEEANR